jgi:hypothetical protein
VVATAFKNYKIKTSDAPRSKSVPTSETSHTPQAIRKSPNTAPKTSVKIEQTSGKISDVRVEKAKTPSLTETTRPSSHTQAAPETRAASSYAASVPQPKLAEFLVRSNTPKTPSKVEPEQNVGGKAKGPEISARLPDAKTVAAPSQTPDGSGMLGTTRKQDRPEGEKGDKKKDASRGAQGKGATHDARRTTHDGMALEASAGGIASEGEPLWIADLEPVSRLINCETASDEDLNGVRSRSDWFQKYVVKNPDKADVVVAMLAKAVDLDERLTEILEKNLPARNVYGGNRG